MDTTPVIPIVIKVPEIVGMFIGATLGYLLAMWIWERLQLRKMARYAAKIEPITTVIPLEICPVCMKVKTAEMAVGGVEAAKEEGM